MCFKLISQFHTIGPPDSTQQLLRVFLVNSDSTLTTILQICATVLAVLLGWALAYVPQRRTTLQTTFFQLLDNHNKIFERIGPDKYKAYVSHMKSLYKLAKEKEIKTPLDKSVFKTKASVIAQETKISYADIVTFFDWRPKNSLAFNYEEELSKHVFEIIYIYHQDEIRCYFRYLYHVIKFIDSPVVLSQNIKTRLVDFVQAHMTDAELILLFYDGLLFKDMAQYVRKYRLIRNIYKEDLLDESHEEIYGIPLMSKEDVKSGNTEYSVKENVKEKKKASN